MHDCLCGATDPTRAIIALSHRVSKDQDRQAQARKILKHEVEDERFLQIFADFSKIIRRSAEACAHAAKSENPDYEDFVAE